VESRPCVVEDAYQSVTSAVVVSSVGKVRKRGGLKEKGGKRASGARSCRHREEGKSIQFSGKEGRGRGCSGWQTSGRNTIELDKNKEEKGRW